MHGDKPWFNAVARWAHVTDAGSAGHGGLSRPMDVERRQGRYEFGRGQLLSVD